MKNRGFEIFTLSQMVVGDLGVYTPPYALREVQEAGHGGVLVSTAPGKALLQRFLRALAVDVAAIPESEEARIGAVRLLTDVEEVIGLAAPTWAQTLHTEAAVTEAACRAQRRVPLLRVQEVFG